MPAARELDEGIRFPLCQPDALEQAFRNAGLAAIQVVPIDVPTRFRDFDDYWTPFLGGQGPAPSYAMSMDEMSRNQLRDRIRGRLAAAAASAIALVAFATVSQFVIVTLASYAAALILGLPLYLAFRRRAWPLGGSCLAAGVIAGAVTGVALT